MLGKLEKVDLKTIWENEAYNFTPWLAQKENLELLGDAIGIELELEAQEKNVGPFRADILCKNTSDDTKVLQCPKALWFSTFRKDLKLPVDEKNQSLFDTGNEINDLARKCFAEGKKAADGYFDIEKSSDSLHFQRIQLHLHTTKSS